MISLMAAWASIKRIVPIATCAGIVLLIGLCSHFAHRAAANANALREQARQFAQAQAQATQAAQAERAKAAADYETKATEAENAYQSEVASARDALGSYIASHRLQPTTATRAASPTSKPSERNDSNLSEGVPSGAVMVSQADLQACTDTVSYARKARDWAMSLDQPVATNSGL